MVQHDASINPVAVTTQRADRSPSTRLSYFMRNWLLPRQDAGADDKSDAARSEMSSDLRPRTEQADTVGVSMITDGG